MFFFFGGPIFIKFLKNSSLNKDLWEKTLFSKYKHVFKRCFKEFD